MDMCEAHSVSLRPEHVQGSLSQVLYMGLGSWSPPGPLGQSDLFLLQFQQQLKCLRKQQQHFEHPLWGAL